MKKILVSGHTGFIGSNLIESLVKKYEVVGISRNPSKKLKITQIKGDIRKISLKELPKNIFCIIHLAAISGLDCCQKNPSRCFDVNVLGTQKMLEVAKKTNSKFVYLSTSHVYGSPKKLPIKEDHPLAPTSIYSASKLAGEFLSESYARSYGMDVSIIRLFSVYGPKEPEYKVTSEIINQLLTKNTISVGNLYPKRDFVFIKDAVDAIELVLKKSRGFNIFNVGYGKSYSILDLCEILKKITARKNPIKSVKSHSRKQEIDEVVSNCTKIKQLGWKPKVNLRNGLTMSLNWHDSQN